MKKFYTAKTDRVFKAIFCNEENKHMMIKLGASKDVTKYQCYSLVKMNKENYNKAVNLSVEKMLSSISNEVKQEVINTVIENENN